MMEQTLTIISIAGGVLTLLALIAAPLISFMSLRGDLRVMREHSKVAHEGMQGDIGELKTNMTSVQKDLGEVKETVAGLEAVRGNGRKRKS